MDYTLSRVEMLLENIHRARIKFHNDFKTDANCVTVSYSDYHKIVEEKNLYMHNPEEPKHIMGLELLRSPDMQDEYVSVGIKF